MSEHSSSESPLSATRDPRDLDLALAHVRQALVGLQFGQVSVIVQDGVVERPTRFCWPKRPDDLMSIVRAARSASSRRIASILAALLQIFLADAICEGDNYVWRELYACRGAA